MSESINNSSIFGRPSVLNEPSSDSFRRRLIAEDPLQACYDITEAYQRPSPAVVKTCEQATQLVSEFAVVAGFTDMLNGQQENFIQALEGLATVHNERAPLYRLVGNYGVAPLTEKAPL